MKNFWIAAISLMAAVSLAACGASAPAASSSPSSEAVSSGVVSSEKASSESTPEESDASPDSQQLEKMSAPRYVGVVDDFAVNDAGETVLIMKPSHGGDANGSLNIALTKDTSYTIEDGALEGGFGSAVAEYLAEKGSRVPVRRLGVPDRWVMHGSVSQLREECGIDAVAIVRAVEAFAGVSGTDEKKKA